MSLFKRIKSFSACNSSEESFFDLSLITIGWSEIDMLKLSLLENLLRILDIFICRPCWMPSPGDTQTNIRPGKPVLSALSVVMAVMSNDLCTVDLGLARTFIHHLCQS